MGEEGLSLKLVSRFLTEEQKHDVSLHLAENLDQSEEAPAVLHDMMSHLTSSHLNEILPYLKEYVEKAILGATENHTKHAVAFMRTCESLRKSMLQKVGQVVWSGANTVSVVKAGDFQSAPDIPTFEAPSEEDLLHCLRFLESFVMASPDLASCAELRAIDPALCVCLGHRDDHVAGACSSVVRWRCRDFVGHSEENNPFGKFLWHVTFGLVRQQNPMWRANGYVLWLRMCGAGHDLWKHSEYIQDHVIQQLAYWQMIQDGLMADSHEMRKFALAVLQVSVAIVNRSFQTEVFSWDINRSRDLVGEWSRFATLYEIVAIDTSLHQSQAASRDIMKLLSVKSEIHASWGFALLSTGFRAPMDSVRKFCLSILLAVDKSSLNLLRFAVPHLREVFLPFMLLSSHFICRSDHVHGEFKCEYGERLRGFISDVIRSLENGNDRRHVTTAILEVLKANRESFDAVRVYTALGLVEGLGEERVLNEDHVTLAVSLFDDFCEGNLFRQVVQTLNLRLLACFDLCDLRSFTDVLSKFVLFNGFSVVVENAVFLTDYLGKCGVSRDALLQFVSSDAPSSERLAVAAILAAQNAQNLTVDSDIALGLLAAGINMGIEINGVFEGTAPQNVYRHLSAAHVTFDKLFPEPKSYDGLWNVIVAKFGSDEATVIAEATECLRVLNKAMDVFGSRDVAFSSILQLRRRFYDAETPLRSNSAFYKLKEAASGEFHRLLVHFTGSEAVDVLLDLVEFGSTEAKTAESICHIVSHVRTSTQIQTAVNGIKKTWDELVAARLRLSEKDIHCLIIKTMLLPRFLAAGGDVASKIGEFCFSVIGQSHGRRALLPQLMKSLSEFQVSSPDAFERLAFAPEVLARTICLKQNKTHTFRLEAAVARLYDHHIVYGACSNIYADIYGPQEVAARVWAFSMLNSAVTSDFAVSVTECVLSEDDIFGMVNITKQTDGHEEYTRCQAAKVLVSVVDKIPVTAFRGCFFEKFTFFVENDPSPLVRVYFEWMMALRIAADVSLFGQFFDKVSSALATHELRPTLVTVLERILYLATVALDRDQETSMMTRLLSLVVPAAATNKAITRHFSMSLATSIHDEIRLKNLPVDANLASMAAQMYHAAVATDAFGQYRSGDALLWDINGDYDLVSISGGILLRVSDRDVDYISLAEFDRYLSPDQVELLTHPVGKDRQNLWVSHIREALARGKNPGIGDDNSVISPLQTKSGTLTMVDGANDQKDVHRSDLIVVASLVDKPPNLGGICRVCDVLGAGLMTIHDEKVKKNSQFRGVAVTADMWMPTLEVRQSMLVDYLRQQKAQGYTLIGLEQTDKSVELNHNVNFPKKSLIVLGREREGVPGEVLAELDFCVEIKQVGVVRSMNIQTATAVIVHAYSAQHC